MSDISVMLSALEDNRRRLNRLKGDLEKINTNLRAIRNSLDTDIRYRNGIDKGLNDLFVLLEREENSLYRTTKFLDSAIKSYQDSEKAIKSNLNRIDGKRLVKKVDIFGEIELLKNTSKKNNGNKVQGTVEDEGIESKILEYLPGGQRPTEQEIALIDSILDKYEKILVENYDSDVTDTDIKNILDAMVKELVPIVRKHRYDFTWWYEIVKTNGPLDVKNSRTITVELNGKNTEVKIWNQPWSFNNVKYQGDFTGNYLYGYLGAEVFGTGMIGQSILKGAAGAAQFLSDRTNPLVQEPLKKYLESLARGWWGDNEGYSDQIQLGINNYIKDHSSWKKVLDIEKTMDYLRSPIISFPPIMTDEDPFYSYELIEEEPGFKRDIELISLLTTNAIDTIEDKVEDKIGLPTIPEIVAQLNKGIDDLIEWSSNTINNVKESVEEKVNDVKDTLDNARENIRKGINKLFD